MKGIIYLVFLVASFSCSRGFELRILMGLTTANLVVRADAKSMVKESNERDNVYNANH